MLITSVAARCAIEAHVKALYSVYRPHCHLEEPIEALFSTY